MHHNVRVTTPSPDTLVWVIGNYPDVTEITIHIAGTARRSAKQLWVHMSTGSPRPDTKTIRSGLTANADLSHLLSRPQGITETFE